MKQTIRILSVLLALGMMLLTFACKTPDAPADVDATSAPETNALPTEAPVADRDAIAIKLDDLTITAGEIEDAYNEMMSVFSYYGMSAPTDDAQIREYVQMAVEDLVSRSVPQWKANQLGVALTEEELADVDARAHNDADEQYHSVVPYYASLYTDAGEIESVSDLTDEQLATTIEHINEEIRAAFNDPTADLDTYLADIYDVSKKNYLQSAYSDKLRAQNDESVPVNNEAVDAWYADTLASQKESFDADPTQYRTLRESLRRGESSVPLLYVPANLASIRLIRFVPEGSMPAELTEKEQQMKTLETEYGHLLLNDGDAQRAGEIQAEYASLLTEANALRGEYYGKAKKQAEAVFARLQSGEDFAAVAASLDPAFGTEELLLLNGEDESYSKVVQATVASLADGAYSAVFEDDGVYYLVQRVGAVAAGEVERAAIEDAIHAAAAESIRSAAWEELLAAWEAEAKSAAMYYPAAYAYIGH